ncbi:MAG: T9SS type A sorting domain-containing protein [Bacteroidales bacterium]|nr:T9SS type A sorting domain-containing protein [Bacteroidales bacterium]
MKHILLFTAILFPGFVGFGQAGLQQVIATAGGNAANGSIAIEWTFGEPVVATLSGANTILTQGFHQTDVSITFIKGSDELPCTIEIYPNPTGDFVMMTIDNSVLKDVQYLLYDLNGKLLEKKLLVSNITFIGMADYPAGIYLLKILQPAKNITTIEIIKH